MNNEDRPKCVSCSRALLTDEASRWACAMCETEAKENLSVLAGPDGLFAQLVWLGTEALTPGSTRRKSDPVVKSSKTTAPAPVNLPVVNLLGAGGVVHTLQRWVGSWYEDLGFRQPTWRGQHHFVVLMAPGNRPVRRPGQLDNTVKVLLNNLPWAVENREDFGRFKRDVWRFVEDTRSAIDPTIERPARVPVGRCPAQVDGGLICGNKLTADPFANAIRCANCGTTWPRSEWMKLGARLRSA